MSGGGSHLLALLALCALLAGWVTVQIAWRRVFGASRDDPDALAGRLGCRGACREDRACLRRCAERDAAKEEDRP